jgi:MEDS: MEthanogen/methylotroph, DcmR Sensory domain
MIPAPGSEQSLAPQAASCRLVVREDKGLGEVLQFVIAGLEVGQQVVAMASHDWLKELAQGVSNNGMKPDSLLRNGRLVFFAAPDCLTLLAPSHGPFQRGPLRRNGSILRWVSDWSWAYCNGDHHDCILGYQHQIHEFIRSHTSLSLCTVHCGNLERTSLLAFLAEHRRATRGKLLS